MWRRRCLTKEIIKTSQYKQISRVYNTNSGAPLIYESVDYTCCLVKGQGLWLIFQIQNVVSEEHTVVNSEHQAMPHGPFTLKFLNVRSQFSSNRNKTVTTQHSVRERKQWDEPLSASSQAKENPQAAEQESKISLEPREPLNLENRIEKLQDVKAAEIHLVGFQ